MIRGAGATTGLARTFGCALVGILLLQAAWALVVPPFRGLDEHDHAFKAAAVAEGDWSPHHEPSAGGWGELMSVPRDLVEAARPICEWLPYTFPDNCAPRAAPGDPNVVVATSAARYNPVYYSVIGTAARPFDGAAALYAMRAASALLCALVIAAALTVVTSYARTRVLPAAFVLATTPVAVYSTAVAAPNGLEIAAGFLLWASLLALASEQDVGRRTHVYLASAAVGAVLLSTLRTLGPLWLLLSLAVSLLLIGAPRARALLRPPLVRVCLAVTAALCAFGPAWSLVAGTNGVPANDEAVSGLWSALPWQWVLWFFQSVAAFPARDEIAALPLYAVGLSAMAVLLMTAWLVGGRRERWAMAAVVALSTVVAVGVTVSAYAEAGPIWQGRYGLPFSLGAFLIAGAALDRHLAGLHRQRSWVGSVVLLAAGCASLAMSSIGTLGVLFKERVESPLAGSAEWATPSTALVVALVLAGTAAFVAAAAGTPVTGSAPVGSTRPQARPAELAETQRSSVA